MQENAFQRIYNNHQQFMKEPYVNTEDDITKC